MRVIMLKEGDIMARRLLVSLTALLLLGSGLVSAKGGGVLLTKP